MFYVAIFHVATHPNRLSKFGDQIALPETSTATVQS
jgi:hypothetical protein